MLMGLINWSDLWIYLIAQALGAAVAAVVFRYLNPGDAEGGPLAGLPKITVPKVSVTKK